MGSEEDTSAIPWRLWVGVGGPGGVRPTARHATLAARHWRPWHALGVAYISNPGGKYEASLDYPVSLGDYRCARDPSQPIVLHLEHTPCAPGF